MTAALPLTVMVLVGVGSPAVLLAVLGGASIANRPLPERWTGPLAAGLMLTGCAALAAAFVIHGASGGGARLISYGAWSTSHEGGIAIEFLVDRLSLAFATLAVAIAGVVSAFSNRYLHREAGYNRYFVLLALFVTGMVLVALAGNVEVLFVGWEFVGLSSALLVAFFQDRPAPVSNALRVLTVYRISDAAMLSAAVWLRHVAGTDSLSLLFGGARASSASGLDAANATVIAVLLIIAVAGKSALLPFSGWLPRAMEGPTPSSAVYYGSLSIHAGCFLLLRSAPLLEQAATARVLAGTLGAATAVFAGIATRVQSDVKSSLAYAALTQVGIIVVEIAVGWYAVAFVHLAGHACFRLLQFLSAPNVLHDLHGIEAAIGERPRRAGRARNETIVTRLGRRLFLVALERGFLDSGLDRLVVRPFIRFGDRLTRLDEWLCATVVSAGQSFTALGGDDRDE
ncbi:MAG TPA: proton-conducting transporter membrane subunit [Vicinamibacterales bacterium]|nr:proton-conducting transporter membrane subunit [Vicinamibacterales bacterium]